MIIPEGSSAERAPRPQLPPVTANVVHQPVSDRKSLRSRVDAALTLRALLALPLNSTPTRLAEWFEKYVLVDSVLAALPQPRYGMVISELAPTYLGLTGAAYEAVILLAKRSIPSTARTLIPFVCRALWQGLTAAVSGSAMTAARRAGTRLVTHVVTASIPFVGWVVSGVLLLADAWLLGRSLDELLNIRRSLVDAITDGFLQALGYEAPH